MRRGRPLGALSAPRCPEHAGARPRERYRCAACCALAGRVEVMPPARPVGRPRAPAKPPALVVGKAPAFTPPARLGELLALDPAPSLAELREALGVSEATLRRWLRSLGVPPARRQKKAANAGNENS